MNDEDIILFEDDSTIVLLSDEVNSEPISSELESEEPESYIEDNSDVPVSPSDPGHELPSEQINEGTIIYVLDEQTKSDIHYTQIFTGMLFVVAGTAFIIWIIGVVAKELGRFF